MQFALARVYNIRSQNKVQINLWDPNERINKILKYYLKRVIFLIMTHETAMNK